jgi:hypothetical protein
MEYQIPWCIMRASELLRWQESDMYNKLLKLDDSEQPQETEETEEPKGWDFLGSW